jgi:hypothetical protein
MLRPPVLACLFGAAALTGTSSAASLDVYLSPPQSQSTFVGTATTETFNALSTGAKTSPFVSAIGTYEFSQTARMAVVNADQYGGANSSRYIALGAQSGTSAAVTLDLNKPATYFGFWWSAGDTQNGISFYYNSTLLSRITTSTIISLLHANGNTVTAINGTTYPSSSYNGNPNNHLDSSEPFSYVNVIANGTGFNKIVFDNSGSRGSGFESDNHSVYLGSVTPTGGSVFVQSAPAIPVALTPEPAGLAFLGIGLIAFRLARFRK